MSLPILSREQILSQVLRVEEIEVPEWNGAVLIQELTSGRRDLYESSLISDAQEGKSKTIKVTTKGGEVREVPVERFRARLVAMSLVYKEEDGTYKHMFQPGEEDLVAELGANGVNRVADAVVKLNGMSADELDEIKKDSEQITEEDSNSA